MALENCYVTVPQMLDRLTLEDSKDTATIEPSITSSCRAIDIYCGQFFYDAGSPSSARTFRTRGAYTARVDPFHTATPTIKTDTNDDGLFATTWTTADYELECFGGDMAGMLEAPWDTIHAIGSYTFLTSGRRRFTLQVTAQWGWAAVPAPVFEAAQILTQDLWARRNVNFGIATGTVEFGGLRIGRDVMAQVASLLYPFRRVDRVLGIAG